MTFQSNDNLANRELSIEELETISGGDWLGAIVDFFEGPYVAVGKEIYNDLGLGKPGVVYASGAHRLR
jgi:bacteriocin-like protein